MSGKRKDSSLALRMTTEPKTQNDGCNLTERKAGGIRNCMLLQELQ